MRKIVVVGSLNMDLTMHVPRMPKEGETVLGDAFAMYAGGKGGNQAVAAARLGGNVAMVGAVGEDAFGETLRASLVQDGIDAQAIQHVAGSSGCATILVARDGSNSIVVHAGANARLQPADLERQRDLLGEATILLCQLEIPLETVSWLCQFAAQMRIPLVLDPAPMQLDASSMQLLKDVTWLTPNETETRSLLALLGDEEADLSTSAGVEAAAEALQRQTGAHNVLLKLGSRGAYVLESEGSSCHVPVAAVTAVDTTAAGDTFNGAFAFALAHGAAAPKAAAFACKAAARSTLKPGAQASMPTMTELGPDAWEC